MEIELILVASQWSSRFVVGWVKCSFYPVFLRQPLTHYRWVGKDPHTKLSVSLIFLTLQDFGTGDSPVQWRDKFCSHRVSVSGNIDFGYSKDKCQKCCVGVGINWNRLWTMLWVAKIILYIGTPSFLRQWAGGIVKKTTTNNHKPTRHYLAGNSITSQRLGPVDCLVKVGNASSQSTAPHVWRCYFRVPCLGAVGMVVKCCHSNGDGNKRPANIGSA